MTGTQVIRAAWVMPMVSPPLRDGWVVVTGDRITAVGDGALDVAGVLQRADVGVSLPGSGRVAEIHLGNVALLPGLINAHTHLELTSLRGQVGPSDAMPQWVRALLRARAAASDVASDVRQGLLELRANGTAAVADVSNTLISVPVLIAHAMPAVVFHEVLGFDPTVADARMHAANERITACGGHPGVQVRLAPHAPYSTSADLIRHTATQEAAWPPASIHVAESLEELEFLAHGRGPWRSLLADLGVACDGWSPPRTTPVEYLDGLGFWRHGTLAVHGVQLAPAELETLAKRDVTLVTCPRSNRWVGAGDPPIRRFVESGVRIAVGTDSLASAPDLNLFGELARLRQLAPEVPARVLLSWATTNGATAIGLGADLGAIERGRLARLLAVRIPAGTSDPEEALLAGITAAEVSWVPLSSTADRVVH